ncbi:SH3 domain-containing protein [Limnoraphis robusta]|uniref:SH3 domain-containing protein n=1 Tax=Limnoraphis robusta CCNP1315 TaxID=3110306 RepID=A0ABU5U6V1_9CYAN|nr:SH3 domain-containing protein [Limnoraphis robusta]MEA5522886.1 SH3 domain-containing protein [Limnoraphis robusta CCNP1315]MEA5546852.1 SH3 domain-containing protein [Limnoraphis robusta CCNP1324]
MLDSLLALACTTYIINDPGDTYVNMRKSPNGQVIKPVPNGLSVKVLGEYGNWYRVRQRYDWGWMYKPLLRPDTRAYILDFGSHTVDLKKLPNQSSDTVKQVLNGSAVELVDRSGDWLQVKLEDGSEGYIPNQYIKQASCYH